MRKLKLQMQMTINGFVAGPQGENDWMTWNPDDEFMAFLNSLIDSSDTMLLGRKLATSGFIEYWENASKQEKAAPMAKKIAELPKIVFSKTLEKSSWKNTSLVSGNLVEEISRLKKQDGKDIIVFGGAGFVSSLINEGLIDEYYLIINPTTLSSGMTIFNPPLGLQKFTPVSSRLYSGGKTVLNFKPKEV